MTETMTPRRAAALRRLRVMAVVWALELVAFGGCIGARLADGGAHGVGQWMLCVGGFVAILTGLASTTIYWCDLHR